MEEGQQGHRECIFCSETQEEASKASRSGFVQSLRVVQSPWELKDPIRGLERP